MTTKSETMCQCGHTDRVHHYDMIGTFGSGEWGFCKEDGCICQKFNEAEMSTKTEGDCLTARGELVSAVFTKLISRTDVSGSAAQLAADIISKLPRGMFADEVEPKPSGDAALDVGIIKSDERISQIFTSNRLATSWQANLFIELVKGQMLMAVPVDEFTPNGSAQLCKTQTVKEAFARALEAIDPILSFLESRKLVAPLPTLAELKENEPEQAGFIPGGDRRA